MNDVLMAWDSAGSPDQATLLSSETFESLEPDGELLAMLRSRLSFILLELLPGYPDELKQLRISVADLRVLARTLGRNF